MLSKIGDKQLFNELRKVLIKECLITKDDIINISKIYEKQQRGKAIQHYTITISNKKEQFFVRMSKENDNSFHVMPFLKHIS